MKYKILQGDVRQTLAQVQDQSVQCVVTSPPYYGLRDYGVDGQIGLEQTPEEYVAELVNVFREVKRVLKDDGTLWLNLGDSYAGSMNGSNDHREEGASISKNDNKYDKHRPGLAGLKPKDLIGIPWRVAFALQADGWYLRQDIIWHKPNPMPESVTDRCTKAHEYTFLLSKSPKYYYDNEAIKEPVAENTNGIIKFGGNKYGDNQDSKFQTYSGNEYQYTGSRNKRSVWTVTTKSYKGAHFATFPMDLIEPCILAGTSEKGQCSKCGKPYVRIIASKRLKRNEFDPSDSRYRPNSYNGIYKDINGKGDAGYTETKTIGWEPQCNCNAEVEPQIVLDPFNGSGTTGYVAMRKDRNYIGCELNPEYIRLSRERFAGLGFFVEEEQR